MIVLFRTQATGRDIMANGVISNDALSIACTRPGASLCNRGAIASGVQSFVAKPVPPVVTSRLTGGSLSVHRRITRWISVMSSGTISTSGASHLSAPSVASVSRSMSALRSVDGSAAAVSETMRMAGFNREDIVTISPERQPKALKMTKLCSCVRPCNKVSSSHSNIPDQQRLHVFYKKAKVVLVVEVPGIM